MLTYADVFSRVLRVDLRHLSIQSLLEPRERERERWGGGEGGGREEGGGRGERESERRERQKEKIERERERERDVTSIHNPPFTNLLSKQNSRRADVGQRRGGGWCVSAAISAGPLGTHFPCFTGTKVQILTKCWCVCATMSAGQRLRHLPMKRRKKKIRGTMRRGHKCDSFAKYSSTHLYGLYSFVKPLSRRY